MSKEQLITEAMGLPLSERVSLAEALWQSIDEGLPESDEQEAIRDSQRRQRQLASGTVEGLGHEEVMHAARRAIGCE